VLASEVFIEEDTEAPKNFMPASIVEVTSYPIYAVTSFVDDV